MVQSPISNPSQSETSTGFLGYHGGGCHVARTLSAEIGSTDRSFTSIIGNLPMQNERLNPQLYFHMSTAGSYTDFHIDFGGSSLWMYLMKGEIWFYFIPPTAENVKKYENWLTSAGQSTVFFGDSVSQCFKCEVHEGSLIMVPSGWIHGIYCAKDSAFFGGNFFNSLHMSSQVAVQEIEERAQIPQRFLYPRQYTFMWYASYWYCRQLLKVESDECAQATGSQEPRFDAMQHLTEVEFIGLTTFVNKLKRMISAIHIPSSLSSDKAMVKKLYASGADVPFEIPEPRLMLLELQRLLSNPRHAKHQGISDSTFMRPMKGIDDNHVPKARNSNEHSNDALAEASGFTMKSQRKLKNAMVECARCGVCIF